MPAEVIALGERRARVRLAERTAARQRCRAALEAAAWALAEAAVEGEGVVGVAVERRLARLGLEVESELARLR